MTCREPDGAGVATVDETPVGVYIELEGPPSWIDGTARRIGFRPSDYITASYGALYLEWRRQNDRAGANMVFPPTRS